MLSVKAREAADTIFQVFGMTQLRIKPILPRFAGEHSKASKTIYQKMFCQISSSINIYVTVIYFRMVR